jgi:hypothetical protein
VSSVNPWDMILITVDHSSKKIPRIHFGYRKRRRVVIVAVLKEANTKEVLEVVMGLVATEDMVEGEVNPPLVLIVDKLVIFQGLVPKCTCFFILLQS